MQAPTTVCFLMHCGGGTTCDAQHFACFLCRSGIGDYARRGGADPGLIQNGNRWARPFPPSDFTTTAPGYVRVRQRDCQNDHQNHSAEYACRLKCSGQHEVEERHTSKGRFRAVKAQQPWRYICLFSWVQATNDRRAPSPHVHGSLLGTLQTGNEGCLRHRL